MEHEATCHNNNQGGEHSINTPRGKTENSVLSQAGHSFRSRTLLGNSQVDNTKIGQKKGQYVISYNFDHTQGSTGITHNIFIGWDDEPSRKPIKKIKSQQGISTMKYKSPGRDRLPLMSNIVREEEQKQNENVSINEPTKRARVSKHFQRTSKQCSLYQEKESDKPELRVNKIFRQESMPAIRRNNNKDRVSESIQGKNSRTRNNSFNNLKPISNPMLITGRNSEKEKPTVKKSNEKLPPTGIILNQTNNRANLASFSSNKTKNEVKDHVLVPQKNNQKKSQYRNGKTIENNQIPKISSNSLAKQAKKEAKLPGKQVMLLKNQKELQFNDQVENNSKMLDKSLIKQKEKQDQCGQTCDYGADTLKLIQDLQKMESESTITKDHEQKIFKQQNSQEKAEQNIEYHQNKQQPAQQMLEKSKLKDLENPISKKNNKVQSNSKNKKIKNSQKQEFIGQKANKIQQVMLQAKKKAKMQTNKQTKQQRRQVKQEINNPIKSVPQALKQDTIKSKKKEQICKEKIAIQQQSSKLVQKETILEEENKINRNELQNRQIVNQQHKALLQDQRSGKKKFNILPPVQECTYPQGKVTVRQCIPIMEQKIEKLQLKEETQINTQVRQSQIINSKQDQITQLKGKKILGKELEFKDPQPKYVKKLKAANSPKNLAIKKNQISVKIQSKKKKTPEATKRVLEKKDNGQQMQKKSKLAKEEFSLKIQPPLKQKQEKQGSKKIFDQEPNLDQQSLKQNQVSEPNTVSVQKNQSVAYQKQFMQIGNSQKKLDRSKTKSGAAIHRNRQSTISERPKGKDPYNQKKKNMIQGQKAQNQPQNTRRNVIQQASKSLSSGKILKYDEKEKEKTQQAFNDPQVRNNVVRNDTNQYAESDSELETTPISHDSQAPRQITCISKKSHSRNPSINRTQVQKPKTPEPKLIKIKELRNASVQIDNQDARQTQKVTAEIEKNHVSIGTSAREIVSKKEQKNSPERQMIDEQVQYEENKQENVRKQQIGEAGLQKQHKEQDQNIFSFANISCQPKIQPTQKQSFLDIEGTDKLNHTDFLQPPKMIQRKFNNSSLGSGAQAQNNIKQLTHAPIVQFIYGDDIKEIEKIEEQKQKQKGQCGSQFLTNWQELEERQQIVFRALKIVLQIDPWLVDRIIEPFLNKQGHYLVWLYCKGQWKFFSSNLMETQSMLRDVISKALARQYSGLDASSVGIEEIVRMITGLRVMQLKNKKKLSQELEHHIQRGYIAKGVSMKPQKPYYSITGVETTAKMQKLIQIETASRKQQQQGDNVLWIKQDTFEKYFDYFLIICYRKKSWWTSKSLRSNQLTDTLVFTLDCLSNSIGSLQIHSDSQLDCKLDLYKEVKPKILKFIGRVQGKNPTGPSSYSNPNLCFNFTMRGRYYLMVKMVGQPVNSEVHFSLESSQPINVTYLESIQHETLKNSTSEYIEISGKKMKNNANKSTNNLAKSKLNLKDEESSFHEGRSKNSMREQFIKYLMDGEKQQVE